MSGSHDTITLTFRQHALLVIALEEQVSNLRSKASDYGLLTKEHLNEYETLLDLIHRGHTFQVETPTLNETA